MNKAVLESGWPLYKALGFGLNADMGAVDNDFYKALAIPDPGVARQVSLVRLPSNPFFVLDLVEWAKPATVGAAPSPRQAGLSPRHHNHSPRHHNQSRHGTTD